MTKLACADLDDRRRRILFRSWHRGMKETDLILGGYADAEIANLSDRELEDFESLLDAMDRDVLGWVTGEFAPPKLFDTELFRKICAFHTHAKPLHK